MLDSIVQKLNSSQAAKELSKAWFVEQQQIKKAFAPNLWVALVKGLEQGCADIRKNTSARVDVDQVNHLEVRIKNADSGVVLVLSFDAHTPVVWYRTAGPSGHLGFKVNEDGSQVKFLDPKNDSAMFVDEAVEMLFHLVV